MLTKEEFLELLQKREALNKDIGALSGFLMGCGTSLAGNGVADVLNLLQHSKKELEEEILAYTNTTENVDKPLDKSGKVIDNKLDFVSRKLKLNH